MTASVGFRLYLITDRFQCEPHSLASALREACLAGVKAVQLREKDLSGLALYKLARLCRDVCSLTQTKLLINDRADVARACRAEGVHLTSQSLQAGVIRRTFPAVQLIGGSTHSIEEARQAEAQGCDFVLFGPVFQTATKAKYGNPQGIRRLREIAKSVTIPVFAVGGITPDKAKECVENGAAGVAVISSILGSSDIGAAVREFEAALGQL